ncbi:hypothetical protein [Methanobrevibacter sp.]|uniref:hypothetical protein n=1 Tax=Methanobrevibacter sp. TaxID=66852 RepID=UPI00388E8F91
MNLLISIKPEFVEKIMSYEKKYEFRRSIFRKKVEKIYIYSTAPEKKIVGYFEFTGYVEDTPNNLWNNYSDAAGISKESFFDYFKGKDTGFAIRIDNLNIFTHPIDVGTLDNFRAPQSFCYVDDIF